MRKQPESKPANGLDPVRGRVASRLAGGRTPATILRALAIVLVLPLLLGAKGCEPSTVTVTKIVCPQMQQYSAATQQRMAEQLTKILPTLKAEAPDLLRLIGDGRSLRRGVEKCLAESAAKP